MSVPIWPSELPRPTRSDFSATSQEARIAKQADTGPPGYRPRFSSVARPISLAVILSRSQKGRFDRFYIEEIKRGAAVFWMPDPVTDGWPMLTAQGEPVLTADGRPVLVAAQWLCLMGPPPVETIYGQVEFKISFQVDVLP